MTRLTKEQKKIIHNSVGNLIDDLLENFYDEISYEQLFRDLGFKREPDEKMTRVIEDEVVKAYDDYFKKR